MVTDGYLSLFVKYGKHIGADLKNGFKEEIQLNATTLDELIRTENAYIYSPAKKLGAIVFSNQSKLLNDKIDLPRRIAVRANKKLMKLTYHLETGLVSITRRGQIYRKKDIRFIRDVVFSEVQDGKGRGCIT